MTAQQLRAAMAARNISQSELSAMTGIPKSSISQYLSGDNTPREQRRKVIAEVLGCEEPIQNNDNDSDKNLSVNDAARKLGKSVEFVRAALRKGVAPFGFAVQISGNTWCYHISPKKFNEYIGYEEDIR